MAKGNGYNLDFYTKTIFEKELEHIKSISDDHFPLIDGQRKAVIQDYLKARIKEINEEYKDAVVTTR